VVDRGSKIWRVVAELVEHAQQASGNGSCLLRVLVDLNLQRLQHPRVLIDSRRHRPDRVLGLVDRRAVDRELGAVERQLAAQPIEQLVVTGQEGTVLSPGRGLVGRH